MIDRSNHSAVELPGDSCKLFANCDRFRGRGLGTQSRKIKANFAPFTSDDFQSSFQSKSYVSNREWHEKCGDKFEINVRFEKEYTKEEISNLEYLDGIKLGVNLVEFVIVSMDFARIRITIHGRVAKEPWELSVGFNAIRLQDGRRINQLLPLSCPDTRKTRVLAINDPLRWKKWNIMMTKFRL